MTIQVCGMSPSRKKMDLVGEAWGLPWDPYSYRYSIWFEMHDRSLWEKRGPEYLRLLQKADVPIYMQKEYADIPNSVQFPIGDTDYYSSSIAYMLDMAIRQLPERLEVWGVDNHPGDEWADERPCNEFWLGYAKASGIDVWVHPESSLLKPTLTNKFNDEIVNYTGRYGWLGAI
jgi:hypothetical protein